MMLRPDAIDDLPLVDLEETSGELHRRIAVALRRIGEVEAESEDADGRSPRERVAALIAALELAAAAIAAAASGSSGPDGRHDRHPAMVSAVMYAAPTIPQLLARLDQDRRLVASLARTMEERLGQSHVTPWGQQTLRRLVSGMAVAEPARCALLLERRVAIIERAAREREAPGEAPRA